MRAYNRMIQAYNRSSTCLNYDFFLLSFLLINSILLPAFLSSCSPSVRHPLLLRADSLMNTRPDSSLALLERIASPRELPEADRAFYALLLTQAKHKNYLPFPNDSLIKIAVEYYDSATQNLLAAKAHYYLGATYRDRGSLAFAVEEYLTAIRLMPAENEFLAMIYNNLAECYLDQDSYNVAMDAYQKAYQLSSANMKLAYYPLRGMGYLFLFQNQLDSALCYLQKAHDCVQAVRDSSKLPVIYNDFATVYEQKKDYARADEYASKAIGMACSGDLVKACFQKGELMLGLNRPDSARYYFDKNSDVRDIQEKAARYYGLYRVEERLGNWEAAVRNADACFLLYDSIQKISQHRELEKVMGNYQLDLYKRALSQRQNSVICCLVVVFLFLLGMGGLCFLWKDRKRQKHYMALHQELMQNRVDAMLLKENETAESEEENADKLSKLREQQLEICLSLFRTTECYRKLQLMERAKPKQLIEMRGSCQEINVTIRKAFIDVIQNLKECCPLLTHEDLFYCVLSLLRCSKTVMIELMNVSPDALKMRKSRIKSKMSEKLFNYIFRADTQ